MTTALAAPGTAPKSLIAKLAEVMAVVERVPKRGRNDFHKYDYATESDIVATVRQELAARHVMLFPSILDITREHVGDKGQVLTTITMGFLFKDGETGEEIARSWAGAGTDKEDKGLYKAMTGGEKYFLLKTFLMPTGDDPERESAPNSYSVEAPTAERPPSLAVARPDPSAPSGGDSEHSNYHTTQRAQPAEPLPPDAVYMQRVDLSPTKNPNVTKARITLSTGEVVSTINSKLTAQCEAVCQDGTPVIIETKTSKWGVDLVAVHGMETQQQHQGESDDDDIPF